MTFIYSNHGLKAAAIQFDHRATPCAIICQPFRPFDFCKYDDFSFFIIARGSRSTRSKYAIPQNCASNMIHFHFSFFILHFSFLTAHASRLTPHDFTRSPLTAHRSPLTAHYSLSKALSFALALLYCDLDPVSCIPSMSAISA